MSIMMVLPLSPSPSFRTFLLFFFATLLGFGVAFTSTVKNHQHQCQYHDVGSFSTVSGSAFLPSMNNRQPRSNNVIALEASLKKEDDEDHPPRADERMPTASTILTETNKRPSIHPPTISALTQALLVRAQNDDRMPLRLSDGVEGYDIMMTAGKMAQLGVREAAGTVLPSLTEEEEQVIAGRIVAIINRFVELEEELVIRATKHVDSPNNKDSSSANESVEAEQRLKEWFGIIKEEVMDSTDGKKELSQLPEIQNKLDDTITRDPSLAKIRAECILALFLNLIEGPGLRANNVKVPCMDVDFLKDDRYEALFPPDQKKDQVDEHQKNMQQLQEELNKIEQTTTSAVSIMDEETETQTQQMIVDENSFNSSEGSDDDDINVRPSLHPLTIDIVSEALKLRAQNNTEAPFRILNDDVEGWEIHYQAANLAEQFINRHQQEATSKDDTSKSTLLTQEECSLVGGRIVGIIMRLEDLEWELLHRCQQYDWISEKEEWDNFGILGRKENCLRTLDERLLADSTFRMKRAERLVALFLLNLEGPGVQASGGGPLPGGSDADFLEPDHYEIMKPLPR